MAITKEYAEQHIKEFAITCCRYEKGTVISPDNIEDPMLIPDLEDSGLVEIPEGSLKIGEVIGATLKETVDALTPLTKDLLEGYTIMEEEAEEVVEETEAPVLEETQTVAQAAPVSSGAGIRIKIGEGKDIDIEIPYPVIQGGVAAPAVIPTQVVTEEAQVNGEAKVVRELTKKYLKINKVEFGSETKIEGDTIFIREDILKDAINSEELVVDMKLDIVTPDKYNEYTNTIMDVQPIATKLEGELGEGVTAVIDGAVIVVTGTDEKGVQIGEFGSSEGILEENIMWDRPGAIHKGEILIKTDVTIKELTNMERPGPMAAHKATDYITQEIREALKTVDLSKYASEEKFEQVRRRNKKKVVIVKEIMGQGAMHDNYLMPVEPVGILGAKANVDLGNVPVVVSPLQVLDGCVHALTCIGPASKEMSRHYFREPLILAAMADEEIDLAGVVFVGSPQANSEKFYVSKLLGTTIETMDVDGAIVTTEGFGNNHVDFASHIEQIGQRGIPVVGMTFAAVQGQLVVGNEYMNAMVDLNKSADGTENEILENNTLTSEDAIRALAMLKSRMAGEEVTKAERNYDANVKLANIEKIEAVTGEKIELSKNETSL